jgi:hypothetical protein
LQDRVIESSIKSDAGKHHRDHGEEARKHGKQTFTNRL